MSRVFRALEKAEKEKRERGGHESSRERYPEITVSKKVGPVLKSHEETVMEFGLLRTEDLSGLVVQPYSFAAEEFRKLKTQIFHKLPSPPHSILITSATPQEGKTTIAINLAKAISEEINRKAILIDGDLRKPGISLQKSSNTRGLSNYLMDGTPLSEILIDSGTENLRMILAGPRASKSAELIGSKKMDELMKSLREVGENTYVIIDSPPLVSTTEPVLLSKMVDGIILVVMAERTPREMVQRALKSIDRQKIIGVVFNQVDITPSRYYSKYYYGYSKK
jgi:capsular exopolysaccharide synthesis family protein